MVWRHAARQQLCALEPQQPELVSAFEATSTHAQFAMDHQINA
jgi:hypothetical protein